ncbi:DUF956 family protein [Dellaglioa algida]|uniref:DUF956 family protein n=1 Tax=Dellaglioa algida TaxID=105612 RepID=A0A5C6M6B0_9LACO|nr:DUF956 family protein [Dellaglioa algida]MDK1717478.1 DUF956 family protein [Dellaglioa algida]MDK1720781.1 DUF956 family protein [Dellaglioa algida]MDK1722450.1 DUF956 family protein [Dellaglioa algida]MDK1724044.1 DUF956 family protein [Dellaglioa algida]MDK1725655.1 DUF956 family protein [Dellaglioa algida]
MVQSINTKVDLTIDATAFTGLADYGTIMIGDKGFEFYNTGDARKFIQIPWDEVDKVIASVMFKGHWIPRYAIETKNNGTFTFASKKPKLVLRTIRNYVNPANMVQALGMSDVLKRSAKSIFNRKNK